VSKRWDVRDGSSAFSPYGMAEDYFYPPAANLPWKVTLRHNAAYGRWKKGNGICLTPFQ